MSAPIVLRGLEGHAQVPAPSPLALEVAPYLVTGWWIVWVVALGFALWRCVTPPTRPPGSSSSRG